MTTLLLLPAAWLPAHGPIPPQEAEWAPGQVLIQLAPGFDLWGVGERMGDLTPSLAAVNQGFAVQKAELVLPHYRPAAMQLLQESGTARLVPEAQRDLMHGLGRWVLLQGDPAADVEAMVDAYATLDEVMRAEPNYLMHLVGGEPAESTVAAHSDHPAHTQTKIMFTPNDPDFGSQWGLAYIQAPDAWDITMGDPSQVIAIIDTGVDLDHPDLVSKIWENDDPVGDTTGDPTAPDGARRLPGDLRHGRRW